MTATLTTASAQWASRPADQRFTSLQDMLAFKARIRHESAAKVVSSRAITVQPHDDNKGLSIVGPAGFGFEPTNWAFGQMAALVSAPAGYLRTLPSPLAADALNYGLKVREVEDIGLLLQQNGTRTMRAATGPNYGRIWDADILKALIQRFGDGVTGEWKVPGEFRQAVTVTKDNTTLYASDRDMFVFLANEENRIDLPNRRDGKPGSVARGFYVWNSEVGKSVFGLAAFLYDFVCCNRMIWGAQMLGELRVRHTAGAPERFLEQAAPVLTAYANGSAEPVKVALANAQKARIETDVTEFLANRFGRRLAPLLMATHVAEEGRPVETLWDATTAVTAYARGLEHQDARIELETAAGELITLASA